MKPQAVIERGAQTSTDVLAMLLGPRSYGNAGLKTPAMFQQNIPPGFEPIADDIHGALQLLKLERGATRDAIYDAYRRDIALLNSRRDGFIAFIKAGIRASIVRAKKLAGESYYDPDKDVETQWSTIEKVIPPAGHAPFITLSADHAALGEAELLSHLHSEANVAPQQLLKLVCFWFDILVSKEFVGLVQFTSAEAARYHYFRPQVTRTTVKSVNEDKQIGFDPTAPMGEQTIYERTQGEIIEVTTTLERHDHDIVHARTHSVEEYPDQMPQRVVDFLNATPAWLRKHLVVVSGTITMERVRRRVVATEQVGEIVTSVYKASPAIALGSYAPIGWSGDDMLREATSFFSQKLAQPAKRVVRNKTLMIVAATLLIVSAIIGAIWYAISESNRASAEAYQAYHQEYSAGRQVLTIEKTSVSYNYRSGGTETTVTKSAMITLPGGQPLYYLGKVQGPGSNYTFTFTPDPKTAWQTGARQNLVLPNNHNKVHYGTVDLGPNLGIPAMMHVLHADETTVQFTIDYYIK